MSDTLSATPDQGHPVAATGSRGIRFLQNPSMRVFLFMAMLAIFSGLMHKLVVLPELKLDQSLAERGLNLWLRAFRGLVPTVMAYGVLVLGIERRRLTEFDPRKLPRHVVLGWLLGMGLLLAAGGAMALFGTYSVHGTHADAYLLGPFFVLGLLPGITEEIVSRGVLFRVVEDGLGTWIALAFSAVLFGAGHLGNPNATVWSSIAIAVEAGLLLGMAYAATRSLWFVMALHAAWNFTQGAILGIPVSGIAVHGLFDSTTQGAPILSGGQFGAEGSILTVIICTSVAFLFTRRAIAIGQVRKPVWPSARTYLKAALAWLVTVAVLWSLVHFLPLAHANPRAVYVLGKVEQAMPVIAIVLAFFFWLGAAPAPSQGRGPREGEAA